MSSATFLGVLGVLLGGAVVILASQRAKRRRWTSGGLTIASVVAVAILAVVVLSDWPTEWLNDFWASHSVLAAVITTVLLAAVAFLAFEAREAAVEEELSEKVSAAGLSGLVDRLVDIDLALLMVQQRKTVADHSSEGRPLHWLSRTRRALQADAANGNGKRSDPTLTKDLDDEGQAEILAQCVRRIAAGMRDWASLVGASADGRAALVSLGEVRLDLLQVSMVLRSDEGKLVHHLNALRRRVQLLAYAFEAVSSGDLERAGVLVDTESTAIPDAIVGEHALVQIRDTRGRGLGAVLRVAQDVRRF